MKQCLAGRIRRGETEAEKERKEKGETLKRDKDSESETGIKRKSGEGRHVRVEVAGGGQVAHVYVRCASGRNSGLTAG